MRAFSIGIMEKAHRLGDGGEKAVQDAGCQVRIKARCRRTPRRSAQRYGREEEEYWESTKVGGEQHGEQSSGSKAEDVSDQIVLNAVLGLLPLPVLH